MRFSFLVLIGFSLGFSSLASNAQKTYPPGTFQLTPEENLELESVPLIVPDSFKDLLPANPKLNLPPGFSVKVFAADLATPRMMAIDSNGVLHVANMRRYSYSATNGQIAALPDHNMDGIADTVIVVADGLRMVNSIAFYQGDLYAAATDQVLRLIDSDADGYYEGREVFIDSIPTRGQHLTRTILFDEKNDKLYVSVGSSCNVCREDSPEEATILQFNADGSGRRIFARGLRNAVGMTLHPITNELWATNHGHDQDSHQNGRTLPPEWVGIVRDGGFYGWPLAYGFQAYIDFSINKFAEAIFPLTTQDSLDVASMTRPEIMLPAHSGPMGVHFYTHDLLPPRYHQTGFIAIHAGFRGNEPGYKVINFVAEPDGSNARIADFITGFRPDPAVRSAWGTPMDIITDQHGNLFISNDNVFIDPPGFIIKVVPHRIGAYWEDEIPELIYTGESLTIDTTLRLRDLDPAGETPAVSVDLSDFGGPSNMALNPTGTNTYRLQATLSPKTTGEKHLSVLVTQQTAYDQLTTTVNRPIQVLPGEDLLVFADQFSNNWQVRGSGGIELLAADSKNPAFAGETVAALAVTNPSILGWRLTLTPDEPIAGPYQALRFAYRPGSGATELSRFTATLRPGKGIPLDETLIDPSLDEWQVVEIPIERFDLPRPIESIIFSGFGSGAFYLDDLRLLTASRPAETAVHEPRTDATPQSFRLQQNIPNPFNSTTSIGFRLIEDGPIELAIYNLSGQRVTTLVDGMRVAGSYSTQWNGQDQTGHPLASGVYLYRLRSGKRIETRKLLLLQ